MEEILDQIYTADNLQVGPNGEICVNTLKKDWTPDLGIRHILLVREKFNASLWMGKKNFTLVFR